MYNHRNCAFCSLTSGFSLSLLVFLFQSSAPGQNLVLQWAFDQPSGDAVDTGTVAPPASGVLGSGAMRVADTPGADNGFAIDLSTPGLDSIVDGGDPAKVDTLEQFTLTTWMKMTGDNAVDHEGSFNIRLLAKQAATSLYDGFSWNLNPPNTDPTPEDPNTTTPDAYRMGLFIGGEIDFGFAFSDADVEGLGGEWTFLAVSYDGTVDANNMSFYWGSEEMGVAQLGSTQSVAAGPLFSSSGTARLGIGFTDAAPTADTSLVGLQDDVRVYDGILDLQQLEDIRLDNLSDVAEGLPGDFNDDSVVDAADYTIWRDNLGSTFDLAGNGEESGGSANVVDQADYVLWANSYAAMQSASEIAAVPEPGSVWIALAAIAAGGCLRARRYTA